VQQSKGASHSWGARVAAICGFVVVIGAWQIACTLGRIPEWLLPAPASIVRRFVGEYAVFARHTKTTASEFVVGFGLASCIGIAYGVVLAKVRLLRQIAYPYVIVLGSLPVAAFAPLVNVWLGYTFAAKVTVATIIAFFPIVTATVTGIRSIPRETIEAARLDGADGVRLVATIELPLSLPTLLVGLRIAWAAALLGAMASELFGADRGLGYLILFALRGFKVTDIFVGTAIVSLMSLGGYAILGFLEKRAVTEMWVQQ
jgi:ABC-type nitrate/sulfonate/bicarbonate transport system permease component